MAGNFEFALAHVDGDYVISIGDDDAFASNAIERVNEIVTREPTGALTIERAQYDWPGMGQGRENQILFTLKSGYEQRQTSRYYPSVLNGWMSYYKIPIIYQGFISVPVLAEVKRRCGKVFLSQQLDLFSALLFGGLVDQYVHVNEPLVINGASSKSNGAQHFGQVNDVTELKKWEKENDIPLREGFEFARSIRFLLAESYLQGRDVFPELSKYPIDLINVLENAIAEVRSVDDDESERIVRRVAARYGVDLSGKCVRLHIKSMLLKVRKYGNWAQKFGSSLVVDCTPYEVNEIAGAVDLMEKTRRKPREAWRFGEQLVLAARRR
jgi:hypothetical protein